MIKLIQFAPALGLPNASPFCLKLETYLRMANVPYEIPPVTMAAFSKAPKGKMPYIEDNGKLIADSAFIIAHLKARYGDPLDADLTPEQRAISQAFTRLLEENLYWAVVYARWIEPAGWAITRPAFFNTMPAPFKWFVPTLARRGLVKSLHGHGMGRHSREEIYAIGQRDITALADYLGEKKFFLGESPSSVDATVYGFLANLIWAPIENPLKEHAKQYPQLEAYCTRMRDRYFA